MPGNPFKYRIVYGTGNSSGDSKIVAVPNGLKSLADLMPLVHDIFDHLIASETNGKPISCGPGCGTCCRQLIPISLPEAFFLRDTLSRMPPKKRKRFKHRMSATLKMATASGLLAQMMNPRENRDVDTTYFKLGLPCPFLEDESCGIYKDRPLACREYLVTSDKRYCRQPQSDRVDRIRIKRNMSALLAVFASRLYSVPKEPIPLFCFLEYTEKHEQLAGLKWPAQANFERLMGGLMQLNDDRLMISIQEIR